MPIIQLFGYIKIVNGFGLIRKSLISLIILGIIYAVILIFVEKEEKQNTILSTVFSLLATIIILTIVVLKIP